MSMPLKFRCWLMYEDRMFMPSAGETIAALTGGDGLFGAERTEFSSFDRMVSSKELIHGESSCRLMLWTGFKDVNGLDIYEEDVLCWAGQHESEDCPVAPPHLTVAWDDKEARWNLPRDDDGNLNYPGAWLVVGNTFQDDDLVKRSDS